MGETTIKANAAPTATGTPSSPRKGNSFSRYFTKSKISPYDEVE